MDGFVPSLKYNCWSKTLKNKSCTNYFLSTFMHMYINNLMCVVFWYETFPTCIYPSLSDRLIQISTNKWESHLARHTCQHLIFRSQGWTAHIKRPLGCFKSHFIHCFICTLIHVDFMANKYETTGFGFMFDSIKLHM